MSPGAEGAGVEDLLCQSRSHLLAVLSHQALSCAPKHWRKSERSLPSPFQTQVQATCLSHVENSPDAPKWCWGKSTGDPLIKWSRSGLWSKTNRSYLQNNLQEGRKKRSFIYSFHSFFSVSCSVKWKMCTLIYTNIRNSLRSVYPPFQLIKPEIKTSICFAPKLLFSVYWIR